jgi:hypothetical protein
LICIPKRGNLKRVHREKLLEDLLKKPFDLNGFKAFAALFACDTGFSPSKVNIDDICGNYTDCIDSCTVIARFTGNDGARVALIEVKLKIAQYAGYYGILQRCFISRFLADTRSDAAVAAFHCEGERSWRLSFVRPIEGFDAKGVKLEVIPVKRYSFIAGEDLLNDPVQKQLHKLFLRSSLTPSLHEIEQTFSQSVIAGEFIRECRSKLPDELPGKLLELFLEELLGYFPSKIPGKIPGKIPNENMIEEILRNYGFSAQESVLNDEIAAIDGNILGRLFESLLKGKARKRSGTFYTPPEIVRYMCIETISNYLANKTGAPYEELRIFLQYGEGLTDEDCRRQTGVQADIPTGIAAGVQAGVQAGIPTNIATGVQAGMQADIPAGIQAARTPAKLPAGVLSRLNEIDDALAGMKVLDPAAGSGAFPVCMLNEIVNARMNITEYLICAIPADNKLERAELRNIRNPYGLKHHAIKNSLYAADIDDTAVNLTKLRLGLSLAAACNEKTGRMPRYPSLGLPGIPMPGLPGFPVFSELECNVVCADSLLDEIEWPNRMNWTSEEKNHFNVVIGNPPYISAVEGSRNDRGKRDALRSKYPLLKGAFDTYTAFLLEGVEKTTADGAYCWVIPNKLLVSGYAEPVLNFMKRNGMHQTVSISDIGAFSGTGAYPIIISGNRRSNVYGEYGADSLHALVYNDIKPKIVPGSYKTFADFGIRLASGATGFRAKLLSGCMTESAANGAIPFIVSGSVDKFHINYNNVRYMGRTYRKAYISKGEGITENKWNFWYNEKIVIAGLTREIEAVYCTGPLALGVGVYAIHGFAGFNPLFLLGLLNSKFMSWYLNVRFSEKHLAGGYLAINKSTLEQLPLVYANETTQSGIAEIVRRIQEATTMDNSCTGALNEYRTHLDDLVYELYGLDILEIKEIEDFFRSRR